MGKWLLLLGCVVLAVGSLLVDVARFGCCSGPVKPLSEYALAFGYVGVLLVGVVCGWVWLLRGGGGR
jgi:hypothetical protein